MIQALDVKISRALQLNLIYLLHNKSTHMYEFVVNELPLFFHDALYLESLLFFENEAS